MATPRQLDQNEEFLAESSLRVVPLPIVGRAAKRLFDLVFAFLAIILFAPTLLIVMIAIRLESPGPIFVQQVRAGRYGELFRLVKFRTMNVHTAEMQKMASDAMFKLSDDPRLTRVGILLRRTSLDELPQLMNVISGEMSMVGPRASLAMDLPRYSENALVRLKMKPGITGYWQVYGRPFRSDDRATQFSHMIEMDREYVEKWSMLLDLKIIFTTVLVALKGDAFF